MYPAAQRGATGQSKAIFEKISVSLKKMCTSRAALSGLSDACTAFSLPFFAKRLRIVPSAAFAGFVAPCSSRTRAIAFSPVSTIATSGAEVMNAESSP